MSGPEVDPNPARDRRVKLPRVVEEEPEPPSAEDRTAKCCVFQGLSEKTLYHAVAGACRAAEIAHFHPHDLRHRRISLWHGQGVPAKEIAERSGHARASISLNRLLARYAA